jgi:hypothetical protein
MNVLNQWALPLSATLPLWVSLSWGMLASACVLRGQWGQTRTRHLALVVFLLTALPSLHVAGYFALAFQTPSLVAVVWALWRWRDALRPTTAREPLPAALVFVGVLLGWALVLDTLNSWPLGFNPQLYAWGFEASALWSAIAVLMTVAVWSRTSVLWLLSALTVLAVFSLTRWPTGNVWDALLDPFVWVALHVQLWQAWRARRLA